MEPNGKFCETYKAAEQAGSWISTPGSDPDSSFHEFQRNYAAWIRIKKPTGLIAMVTVFGGPDEAERALAAGDGSKGKAEGRVLQGDCQTFRDYIAAYDTGTDGVSAALRGVGIEPKGEKGGYDAQFRDALTLYAKGGEPTEFMRAMLNGALFARREFEGTELSGATGHKDDFFAVPGHRVWTLYKRDLSDPGWAAIAAGLEQAATALGTRLINLDLAAMLRLGGGDDLFPPQSPGTGIVIFGAG